MTGTKIVPLAAASALLLIFVLSFAQTVSQGKTIFMREECSNCHNFKGQGGELAPDLTAAGDRRSTLWIMAQIKDPRSHNPDSRMPEFKHLSIIERYAIVRYLRD